LLSSVPSGMCSWKLAFQNGLTSRRIHFSVRTLCKLQWAVPPEKLIIRHVVKTSPYLCRVKFNYCVDKCPSLVCAMVDAFNHWSRIAEALVRSCINPCKISSFLVWPLIIVGVEGYCCTLLHSVTYKSALGLLWTWYRPVSETCTWQHTTFIRGRHPPTLPAGLEPSIPESERSQTRALDRAIPDNICDGHSGTGTPFSSSACFPLSVYFYQCSVLVYYWCCKIL
jgi:hypothetical protein